MKRRVPEEAEWQLTGYEGVDLLRARYVRQSFPRHTHDCFVVCANERGAHASWYRGATVVIPERSLTIVPPGEVHTGRPVPGAPWDYRAMYPSKSLLTELAESLGAAVGATPSFRTLVLTDTTLAEIFIRAHQSAASAADALACESVIADFLLLLIERHASGLRRTRDTTANPEVIRRSTEYIQDCHADRITLSSLAQAAGVSRYALLRAFRRGIGLAPYAFVTQVRVQRAQGLLRNGVGIAEVAARTGFADQSHLNRHFKKLVGVTPGTFARAVRRGVAHRTPRADPM